MMLVFGFGRNLKYTEIMKAKKYKCQKCGWIYDPKMGDLISDIPPGTPFEELPEEWLCPKCYAPKEQFKQM